MTGSPNWKRLAIASMIIACLGVAMGAYGFYTSTQASPEEEKTASAAAPRAARSTITRIVERVRETVTPAPAVRIPAGTTVSARIETHISSRDAQVGDRVSAITTEDVVAGGKVVIPSGTRVSGHVAEVRPASQTRTAAVLRVVFDRIGAHSTRLALASPDLVARARNANRAADVGLVAGGAIAGAVIGHQIDHDRGSEVGAVLGGASGAVAAANMGANVQLKANEAAVLRFTEDLEVR